MEKALKSYVEPIDNKAESKINVSATAPALPEINEHSAPKKEKHKFGKHKPLTAERIFDVSAYGIWNYGIQVGASVVAARWFTEGSGKKYFDKTSKWLGKNVLSKISRKRGIEAAEEFRTPLIFVALITVGNFFIPPLQYAEKHKATIVSWINDKVNAWNTTRGNPPDAEELKDQQESITAISLEPQQTNASLWGGRILGLGANFLVSSGIVGEKRNVAMKNAVADIVSDGLNSSGFKKLGESELMKSYSRIAFLDYGYSIISSNIIYMYSHFINPPKYKNGHERHEDEEALDAIQAVHDVPEKAASAFPQAELKSGSKFVQLKPTNPELVASHDSQLAL